MKNKTKSESSLYLILFSQWLIVCTMNMPYIAGLKDKLLKKGK